MLNTNVSKLLNDQINKEMYSAYLYLDMANYYVNKGLNGFANWFHGRRLSRELRSRKAGEGRWRRGLLRCDDHDDAPVVLAPLDR